MVYGATASLFHSSYDGSFHWHYNKGDPVQISSHHLIPFYNPIESYPYTALPWPCNGEHYNINFREKSNRKSICGKKSLSAENINVMLCVKIINNKINPHHYPYNNT